VTTTDITTEEVSQILEPGLKIDLKVEVNEEQQIAIECNYDGASSVLLLQSIAYMLDTAYNGNLEVVKKVAEQIPDIVNEYCRLKEESESKDTVLTNAIEDLQDVEIKSMIESELAEENANVELLVKLTSELMRRKVMEVRDDRSKDKEESTDSNK